MSRVINPESAGKERTQLSRAAVLSIRELMKQTEPDDHSRDLAAFISLALSSISDTIETSVVAWEKRGYWVKADRFRMDWAWAGRLSDNMRSAVLNDDWAMVALTAAQVAQKLMSVKVPERHRLGTPWAGAYAQLRRESVQNPGK